jgi:hypothetical protein
MDAEVGGLLAEAINRVLRGRGLRHVARFVPATEADDAMVVFEVGGKVAPIGINVSLDGYCTVMAGEDVLSCHAKMSEAVHTTTAWLSVLR